MTMVISDGIKDAFLCKYNDMIASLVTVKIQDYYL